MDEIKEAFRIIEQQGANLRPHQQELIKGFRKYYRRNKQLTERQKAVLLEIKKELLVLNSAEIVNPL